MTEKTLTLKFVKSTKGTHVYGDDSDDAIIPSVYIKRAGLPNTPPASITLVVKYGED